MTRPFALPRVSALVCLAGLALTGLVALVVPVAERGDLSALDSFATLDRARTNGVLGDIASLANPGPYATCGLLLVVAALVRGRRRLAVAIPVVMVGSELMAQGLKQLLAHPRGGESFAAGHIAPASWPSGHATAAMTVALLAIVVAPAAARSAVALAGAAYALAVGYAIVALAWHLPSDVVGGYFCAGLWVSTALVAVRAEAEPRVVRLGALAACAAAAVAVAAVAAIERPAFAVMALAIAALGLGLVAAISSTAAPEDR